MSVHPPMLAQLHAYEKRPTNALARWLDGSGNLRYGPVSFVSQEFPVGLLSFAVYEWATT
jgi:hypothetical protein